MGTALAKALSRLAYPFSGVASRSLSSAERVAGLCGIDRTTDHPSAITREAEVVFITTPDDVIEPVCREIAQEDGFLPGVVVLHCSGAHPSTILSSASLKGAWIGSLHPLQSFASLDIPGNPFEGIRAAVEGDGEARRVASRIAGDLGTIPLEIHTSGKPLYHAAAVVASNFLVTLLDMAFQLAERAGIPSKEVFSVLRPLIDGTLTNVSKVGIEQALTGPVVRGDCRTVETHMQTIRRDLPEVLAGYGFLMEMTARLAEKSGRISPDTREKFGKISRDI